MGRTVQRFIDSHGLDEQCAELLRAQSQAVLYEVMVDFRKALADNPELHSDRSLFSTEVSDMIQRQAEESPLLEVFVDLNGLSADFARLLRLQPRRVQDEVINNLDDYGDE